MKVLVVEDDKDMAELVRGGLASHSHIIDVSKDGADASFLARNYDYDVIILDYALPKKNGLEVCKEIRAAGKTTPIIFLSATDDVDVKIEALESGADDYMIKPFAMEELYARLKAVSRRPVGIRETVLSLGEFTMDLDKHTVTRGGTMIPLTRKEFNMLEYFMRHKGAVVSRTSLLEHAWTADSNPFSNTLESHIRTLRKKTNIADKPNMIANVPGRGYIMDTPENLGKLGFF